MDIHKNARLTLRRREDLVEYVARGVTLKLAAANFSVTAKTAAKWVHRFRREGPPGLWDRSSRPRRSPRRTSSSLTEEVIALRRQPHPPIASPRPPSSVPPPSVASAARSSQSLAHSIPRPRWSVIDTPLPAIAPSRMKGMTGYQSVSIRATAAVAVALSSPARRPCTSPSTITPASPSPACLPNQTVDLPWPFYVPPSPFTPSTAFPFAAAHRRPGSCYRSHRFRAACEQLGIRHRFTRPYTPRTNGKAECFIQTALREWAYVRHYTNSEERDQQLSPWLHYYNFARPHGSLGYAPPISRAAPRGTTS